MKRTRRAEDRRKGMVEMGPRAFEMTERYYGPIGEEGLKALELFSDEELEVVRRFLARAVELQEKHLAAVQAQATAD
jgi:DNA-binding MarR family transcriptional regulator